MTDVQEQPAVSASDEAVATADVVDRLAERLYSSVRRLDPIEDEPEWPALSEDDQRFYRALIEDLVRCPDAPLADMAAKVQLATTQSPRAIRRKPVFSVILWVLLVTAAAFGGLALSPGTMTKVVSSLQQW